MGYVRWVLTAGILGGSLWLASALAGDQPRTGEHFLRFRVGDTTAYGVLEGDRVRQLSGDLFGSYARTDRTYALGEVRALPPTVPTQVLAMAGNYKSRLAGESIPPKSQIVQPFYKSPSCLIANGEAIVIPKDSPGPVHAEGELVIVIGK